MLQKKTTRNLFLLFGTVLLLVCANVSARAQDPARFVGLWNVTTDLGEKFVLKIYRRNNEYAYGRYGAGGGAIQGTVRGNVMRFTWRREGYGQGAGRLTLSLDGQSFQGTVNKTKNPDDTSGGTWTGTRAP